MYHKVRGPRKLQVAKSRVPNGGYGVIAREPIRKGELLEVCPFIEMPKNIIFGAGKNILQDYVFTSHCKPNHALIVFGYGSMYNHAKNPKKQNVFYRINGHNRKRFLDFVALRDIPAGTELLINYGPGHQVNH